MTPGRLVHSFFVDYLPVQRGLRPSSIRSYRDAVRLFLSFLTLATARKISRLKLEDFSFERVLLFLRHLERERGNHVRTRNQRLAALKTFFQYLGTRTPEMLIVAERVQAISAKRVSPPETHFLEREDIEAILARVPSDEALSIRDHALLLFLYNTGARAQEAADLRVGDLDLISPFRVRLHGKGDKWRVCPLWKKTARCLQRVIRLFNSEAKECPVFPTRKGAALTRHGVYKIVRRHTVFLEKKGCGPSWRVTPHTFRHTTAVHLLESGVEINVIRGWLGHVSLETTNRYAEINIKAMEAAMSLCEPPTDSSVESHRGPVWRHDDELMNWLKSL